MPKITKIRLRKVGEVASTFCVDQKDIEMTQLEALEDPERGSSAFSKLLQSIGCDVSPIDIVEGIVFSTKGTYLYRRQ